MTYNWFTPLPPDRTEIANFSASVVNLIAEKQNVQVFTDTKDFVEFDNNRISIKAMAHAAFFWKRVHSADYNFFQIGNDIRFHGSIIEAARRCSGILVLHDLNLHESIRGLIIQNHGGKIAYYSQLLELYGEKALAMGRDYLEGRIADSDDLSTEYPMFQWLFNRQAGIITHNPLNLDLIKDKAISPILLTPLPYLKKNDFANYKFESYKTKSKRKLIVFGFLNGTNRRIDKIFKALANFPQKDQITLTVAGVYNEKDMNKLIQESGLAKQVALKGFTKSHELDNMIREADLAINLRFPSRGEASATLLRVWNQSTPCLVTRTGYYATLKQGTVEWVDPENEIDDLQFQFKNLIENPAYYQNIGKNGRDYLGEEHSLETYVERIEAFLPEVDEFHKKVASLRAAERITKLHLGNYPVVDKRNSLIARISKEVNQWL